MDEDLFDDLDVGAFGDEDASLPDDYFGTEQDDVSSIFDDSWSSGLGDTNWGNLLGGLLGLGGQYMNAKAGNKANDALGVGLQNMLGQADPFASSRPKYVQQLNDFMGNPSEFLNTPYAKAIMDAGRNQVERSMAAQGYAGSGNMAAALSDYGQKQSASLLQNQFQNLFNLSGAGVGQLAGADIMGNIAGLNAANATRPAQNYNNILGALGGSQNAGNGILSTLNTVGSIGKIAGSLLGGSGGSGGILGGLGSLFSSGGTAAGAATGVGSAATGAGAVGSSAATAGGSAVSGGLAGALGSVATIAAPLAIAAGFYNMLNDNTPSWEDKYGGGRMSEYYGKVIMGNRVDPNEQAMSDWLQANPGKINFDFLGTHQDLYKNADFDSWATRSNGPMNPAAWRGR